jgi:hypothetical protein
MKITNNLQNIVDIYNKIRKYRWCHYTLGKFYINKNKLFTIPPIIFASATSFVILNEDGEESLANHYISAILSMLTAMISGVSMHLGYNAKGECHMMSGSSYDELVTRTELYIKFNYTNNNHLFIKTIREELLKIKYNNKYQIPQWVFDEYKKLPDEDKFYHNLLHTRSSSKLLSQNSLVETHL